MPRIDKHLVLGRLARRDTKVTVDKFAETQKRFKKIIIAVIERSIDLAAYRLGADAVLQEPFAVFARRGVISRGSERTKLLDGKITVHLGKRSGNVCGEFKKTGGHDRRGGRIALFAGRAEIPVRNTVLGHILVENREVGNLLREIEIGAVAGLAVHHGVAVYRPRLTARPGSANARALSAALLHDPTGLPVVVEHMKRSALGVEMIFHRHVGVGTGDVGKAAVAGIFCRVHQKLKVHHVVGDDEKRFRVVDLPPTADESEIVVEPARKRLGGFHENRVELLGVQKTARVAVGAIHDKAEIVVGVGRRIGGVVLRPDKRPVTKKIIARRLVEIPQGPRIVAGGPPQNRAHVETVLLGLEAVRNHKTLLGIVHLRRRLRVESLVVRGGLLEDFRKRKRKLALFGALYVRDAEAPADRRFLDRLVEHHRDPLGGAAAGVFDKFLFQMPIAALDADFNLDRDRPFTILALRLQEKRFAV